MINEAAWQSTFSVYSGQTRSTARQAEDDLARIINTCLSSVQHINVTPANFPLVILHGVFDAPAEELRRRTPSVLAQLLTDKIDQAVSMRSVSTVAPALSSKLRRLFQTSESGREHDRGFAIALASYIRASVSEPRLVGDKMVSAPWN